MNAIRLALINAHPVLLEGLTTIFEKTGRFSVINVGVDGSDAMRIIACDKPEVVIADLDGDKMISDVLPALVAAGAKVVVFTGCDDVETARLALNGGASGYVLTRTTATELVAAVDAARRGEIYVSPAMTGALFGMSRQLQPELGHRSSRLSHREEQIVKMLLLGKKNRDIAANLNLSEKTVKCYMTGLMQKLNARSRLEVVLVVQQRAETSWASSHASRRPAQHRLNCAAAE
ncbi:MAG: response regulator transcription factor [Beijerinckiaceae bacterium]|nr:response regulator transcription factor [Beijerinckiaceae bacterium]